MTDFRFEVLNRNGGKIAGFVHLHDAMTLLAQFKSGSLIDHKYNGAVLFDITTDRVNPSELPDDNTRHEENKVADMRVAALLLQHNPPTISGAEKSLEYTFVVTSNSGIQVRRYAKLDDAMRYMAGRISGTLSNAEGEVLFDIAKDRVHRGTPSISESSDEFRLASKRLAELTAQKLRR